MDERKRRLLGWGWAGRASLLVLAVAATGTAGAAISSALHRAGGLHLASLAPPCLFHSLTGLHCPGCGSTRAFFHIARGEPLAAVGSNPLLVLALPLLLLAVLESHTAGAGQAGVRRIVRSPVIGWGFAVATILFAVLRNIPFGPFRWLAP